jgi:hypothetical protein
MRDEFYYEQLKDCTLEVIERGQKVQVFRLRKYPNNNMMSTLLVFVPGAVIITGDLRVKDHGLQALGYGLDWFKERLDPQYLAQKFLETCWVPEHARAYVREIQSHWKATLADNIAEIDPEYDDVKDIEWDQPELNKHHWRFANTEEDDMTVIEVLDALLIDERKDFFSSPGELYAAMPEWTENEPKWTHSVRIPKYHRIDNGEDSFGGYGYPDHEVGWLAAINRRFSELYTDMPPLPDSLPVPHADRMLI